MGSYEKNTYFEPMGSIFVRAQLRPPEAKSEKSDLGIRLSKAQSIFCQEILALKLILGRKKNFLNFLSKIDIFQKFFLALELVLKAKSPDKM